MKQSLNNPGGVNLYAAEFIQYAFHFAATVPDKDIRKTTTTSPAAVGCNPGAVTACPGCFGRQQFCPKFK
jgi:hypothetical protein